MDLHPYIRDAIVELAERSADGRLQPGPSYDIVQKHMQAALAAVTAERDRARAVLQELRDEVAAEPTGYFIDASHIPGVLQMIDTALAAAPPVPSRHTKECLTRETGDEDDCTCAATPPAPKDH